VSPPAKGLNHAKFPVKIEDFMDLNHMFGSFPGSAFSKKPTENESGKSLLSRILELVSSAMCGLQKLPSSAVPPQKNRKEPWLHYYD